LKLEEDIIIPSNLEINPYLYLDITLKYKYYLQLINLFGGYMFLTHIYKFSLKEERQTFTDIHEMEKSKLLKVITINKNSYVLLTKISIRYLKNKSTVGYLHPPSSTQLKTSCYLADYISKPKLFYDSAKPYTWFLEKYKKEIKNFKAKIATTDKDFLINNKELVMKIKDEEIKSKEFNDVFSELKASRIYFDTYENGIVTLLILDFDRTKEWICNSLSKKIEPIFQKLPIYNSYNIKILTLSEDRKERLKVDINDIKFENFIFLKNINIVNLDIDRFFNPLEKKESFLKDIDTSEMKTLQEKLQNNTKG